MRVFSRMPACAVLLSAAAVLVAATATNAGSGATPIATGQGLQAESGANLGVSGRRDFSFSVVEMPDGTVAGEAHVVQVGGVKIFFDVTSYGADSTGIMWIAGPVTKTQDGGPLVGFTAIIGIKDNGASGKSDAITLLSALPPQIGPFPTTSVDEVAFVLSLFFGYPNTPDALRVPSAERTSNGLRGVAAD
jgi:hypothetical protein